MKFSLKIFFMLGIMLAAAISMAGCISSETPASSGNLVLDTPVQYADVNNISIGYREFGSETSEPLLISIGYTTLMDDVDPDLISMFAENYHVYVYDHRGMGHTTRDVEPYQFMQLVDDADSLIGALGYDKMYIFGHSMGSMITQHLLIYYPDNISKAVLCSTTFSVNTNETSVLRQLVENNIANPDTDRGVYLESLAVLSMQSTLPNLSSVHTSTLVICGTADPLTPIEDGYIVAGAINGAWFTPFIGANHSVPYQMGGEIVPLVDLFFQNSEVYTS
ncbi:MAG: alpha/beta fold hydrolase [Methanocorpusculum sp.]|nr:alpha/beta fold hydrolase [Methanocorpusculum sp.]